MHRINYHYMKRSLQLTLTALLLACITGCLKYEMPTIIELNTTSLVMEINKDSTLRATIKAPQSQLLDITLSWSSGNELIATVDPYGKVKAIAVGNARITVTTSNGVKASCELIVVEKIIPATSIALNETMLSIATIGASATLSATVAPENATIKTIIWASSAENIATVNKSGKVTAKAEGIAYITATNHDSTKTATCMVVIGAPIIPVTNITLNKGALSLKIGESDNLSATVTPENATVKSVTWSSNNNTVATVDASGKVTAKAAGTAKITAQSGEKSATCNVTVFTASGTFGSLSWTLTPDGILSISGTGAMQETNIPWASYKNTIKTINISNGVTSIGNSAFANYSNLASITIPNSVRSIGSSAFSECSKLVSVNIPDGITAIRWNTFQGCSSLPSITIPASVNDVQIAAFDRCPALRTVTIRATYPPMLDDYNFTVEGDLLIVPSGSANSYRYSEWGNCFESMIERQ